MSSEQSSPSKGYDPRPVEQKQYSLWLREGLFRSSPNSQRRPYCVMIPPPNITGRLTMGHVLNNTYQDVLVRYHRMLGEETLWQPGTDHAGIATQNAVEKSLAKEGLSRHELGREEFLKRVWEWKKQYGETIIAQLQRLGCSCDWSRLRFTMDEGLSRAVSKVFVTLYDKGLIYRGRYIINWCPRCTTALSDEEVNHEERDSRLWYIRYPLKDSDRMLVVATTRPETLLGDMAVAVNPGDQRYGDLRRATAILPLVGREIPVLGDECVDPEFGTGAVKVTPAHDPADYEMAQRHGLTPLLVMDERAVFNDSVPQRYRGLDRQECRKVVLADLEEQGLLVREEPYRHAVGKCYRCESVVEPYLSTQWFVKMKPLAGPAIEAVRSGKIRLFPDRWHGVYMHWMENIRDWCISRQIWWGHRIPVYYCDSCGGEQAAEVPPRACSGCGSAALRQDENVLDTWFSSWLWPFSTLGWPEETTELAYYYPTQALITAPDIIFFWVARMIMAGLEFKAQIPFSEVYLHGVIRDTKGRKMSKSLGNSPDPLEIIEQHGADALRFALIYQTPHSGDLRFDERMLEMGRHVANKLWNAARLVPPAPGGEPAAEGPAVTELADRWILSRLQKVIKGVGVALNRFEFDDAARLIHDFAWHEYCDWYLELVKPRLSAPAGSAGGPAAMATTRSVFGSILKLFHPFMPFITEELWSQLDAHRTRIIVSAWPVPRESLIDQEAEREFQLVMDVVVAIRTIRAENNVAPSASVQALIRGTDRRALELLEAQRGIITKLAGLASLELGETISAPEFSATQSVGEMQLFVPLVGLVDPALELDRLERQLQRDRKALERLEERINNRQFLDKAPPEVVEEKRREAGEARLKISRLEESKERFQRMQGHA